MILGIAAAAVLVGLALGNLPRTVYSAAYSERETEPMATEARLTTEDSASQLQALEPTEPEITEPEVTEPEVTEPLPTEPELPEIPVEPEAPVTDRLALNGAYILTRDINGQINMAVMDTEDFLDVTNCRKAQPWDEGWICPLVRDTYVTSPYGYRWHPVYGTYRMHKGVDLNSDWYDDIVAPRSGTVIARGYSSSAGYYVKIDHGNGFVSEYFHLADYFVYVGQHVRQGELIALVGSTGTSTGAHLHYGMLFEGSYVDPEDYVDFS